MLPLYCGETAVWIEVDILKELVKTTTLEQDPQTTK